MQAQFNNLIEQFLTRITERFPMIKKSELFELWSGELKVYSPRLSSSSRSLDTSSNGVGCPHVFTKGDKKGTKCGTKSKSGGSYCSLHSKYEGKEPKSSKILPEAKKSSSTESKKSTTKKETGTMLRTHPVLCKLYHPETSLVFKDATNRSVIGKVVKDKLLPLDEADIDSCKKYGFPIFEDSDDTKQTKVLTTAIGLESDDD